MTDKLKSKKIRFTSIIKILLLVFIITLCSACCTSCQRVYNKTDDYHMIFDNAENVNKQMMDDGKRDSYIGFGEYMYCSHFLLLPREKPQNLNEFYFYWSAAIDYDCYIVYFNYTLSDEDYQQYCKHISEFTVSYDGQTNKPIYDEENFDYPTYILTWVEFDRPISRGGLCEYIMLDNSANTVVFVYTFGYSFAEVQAHAKYNIKPKKSNLDEYLTEYRGKKAIIGRYGFSIYSFRNDEYGNCGAVYDVNKLEFDNTWINELR